MYLCYIDESGTSSIPGNTSHFILCGLSIPIWHWRDCEKDINKIKKKYKLIEAEIHTGWLLRDYREQKHISDFYKLPNSKRISQVESLRKAELLRLQRANNSQRYKQTKKNYTKTQPYIHLTFDERKKFVNEIAKKIGSWGFARIFAECIDKVFFDPNLAPQTIDEQAFEQIVSRFEKYLRSVSKNDKPDRSLYGLIIHDNNDTVAKKHTELMKRFHQKGTFWTKISCIIETPLFVDSELTSMVQIADVCAYALRRYLENGETELFNEIYLRADRKNDIVVGVRHYTDEGKCTCEICKKHK